MTRLTPINGPFSINGYQHSFTIKDTLPAPSPYKARMLCEFTASDGSQCLAIVNRGLGESLSLETDDQAIVQSVWGRFAVDFLLSLDSVSWLMAKGQGGPDSIVFKGKLPPQMIREITTYLGAVSAQQRKGQYYTIYNVADAKGISPSRSIEFKVSHTGRSSRYCQFYFSVADLGYNNAKGGDSIEQ